MRANSIYVNIGLALLLSLSVGCEEEPASPVSDATAPASVADFEIVTSTAYSITLTWTAPGDDGTAGTAARYDIRYSTTVITDTNFGSATQVTNVPVPSAAGTKEVFPVDGLSENTTYYFALKTADEVLNWAKISNPINGATEQALRRITSDFVANFPTWSPDGSQVAFVSLLSGNLDIWTVPAVGGAPVQVTTDPNNDASPTWSPDGSQIAFASTGMENFNIWSVPAEGGAPVQVTTGDSDDWSPSWSPDGN